MAGNLKQNKKSASSRLSPGIARMILLLLLLFLAEFFFHTWCGVQCIRTGYEITAAEKRQDELLEMQKSLQVELARLTAPQTLSHVAARRFNLKTPAPEQIVVLP